VTERPAKLLTEMLAELDELPDVLIVFNHPLWTSIASARSGTAFWLTIFSRYTDSSATPSS